MAGQRQPTDLVVMNGRKHLTKAEIEARKNAEVTAPCDKVRPPSYLTPEQKKQFRKIAKELLEIKLISNLDCDALARLLIAQTQYIEITEQIRATPLMEDVPVYEMRENPDKDESGHGRKRTCAGRYKTGRFRRKRTPHDYSRPLHETV